MPEDRRSCGDAFVLPSDNAKVRALERGGYTCTIGLSSLAATCWGDEFGAAQLRESKKRKLRLEHTRRAFSLPSTEGYW